eukprot:TRINITY_DN15910_c0_g2_i1.p1 TRINITY_DN15910_c0_g2~~TRINITY_DN15910_c0_g2_i1.p1  ORF type:complete len:241 (+),score=56.05 TRINITY_DN15910_c0_g2_i1:3-725(+)
MDLGVGCGALLLSILHEFGGCASEGRAAASGTGIDLDDRAVEACRRNASRVLAQEQAARVEVVLADFGQLDTPSVRQKLCRGGYDVIVCNPPYRSEAQQEAYDRASGDFGGWREHHRTLVGGKTGLEMYESVAACLARDSVAVATAASALATDTAAGSAATVAASAASPQPVGSLLRPGGALIFQVEAGSHGQVGGGAARVSDAVERASKGRLVSTQVFRDDRGLERAIIVKHAAAAGER